VEWPRTRSYSAQTIARKIGAAGVSRFLVFGVPKIRLSRYRTQMTDKSESDLAMAARHVAEGRRIVTQQRERIARLKADGHPTADHEQTLRVLEGTLQILEDHERQIAERHARGLV
jgi:hypothetical protein